MPTLQKKNKNSEFCAPLTAFDWNETDPNLIGTCSIDTTCTIWNLEVSKFKYFLFVAHSLFQHKNDEIYHTKIQTQQPKTQLIAHDKEVYDMAFAKGTDIFASVGADGSVRIFDLR